MMMTKHEQIPKNSNGGAGHQQLKGSLFWRRRQVEELEAFLRARGVAPSARDEGTPPETVAEINARMMQAMDKCMTALNLGGLKLQALADAIHTRCA
jgi:hypothetical protein